VVLVVSVLPPSVLITVAVCAVFICGELVAVFPPELIGVVELPFIIVEVEMRPVVTPSPHLPGTDFKTPFSEIMQYGFLVTTS